MIGPIRADRHVGVWTYGAGMEDANAGIAPLAAKAMDLLIEAVQQIPPESWDTPSNLEGWSVRDVVGHATGSAAKILTLAEDGQLWGRSEPADWVCENPAARLRELAAWLPSALAGADLDAPRTSPQGEIPLRQALTYPISDLALHSWDIHRSQGRLVELPEDLVAFCTALVESVPEAMLRRPGGFGPPQPAPDGSSPTARLMAHLGRSVDALGSAVA